jgi:hypothetical protein
MFLSPIIGDKDDILYNRWPLNRQYRRRSYTTVIDVSSNMLKEKRGISKSFEGSVRQE